MKREQVYTLVNDATKQSIGDSAILEQDLSNVVDLGKTILNSDDKDKYVNALINRIGKTIFNDRLYTSNVPNILKDSWEYGSVMQKISCDLPSAVSNPDLVSGTDYSPNIFNAPSVSQALFNKEVTFEIDLSFTDKQLKQSFNNPDELNAFSTMLYNTVLNSLTLKLDDLAMMTINNQIASIMSETTSTQKVNLLALYNSLTGKSLTVSTCLSDKDFLCYVMQTIANYKDRLKSMSKLFNKGSKTRFTPEDKLHTVMLSDVKNAIQYSLNSGLYNPVSVNVESIPYWQGSGQDYSLSSCSKINVKNGSTTFEGSGIIACMFDNDSVGILNADPRVQTSYNPRGEFYNSFFKYNGAYFNDLNENFVVFYIAE